MNRHLYDTYRTQSTLKPSKSKPHKFYGFDHNNIPVDPLHLFFGQFVAEGQRDLIGK